MNIFLDSSNKACKPNTVLLGKIYSYLKGNKHNLTNNANESEYVIVNTCGFTAGFEKETINLLNKYLTDNKKVVSIGCLNKINENAIRSLGNDICIVKDLESLDERFYNNVKYNDIKDFSISSEFEQKYHIQDSGFSGVYSFIVNQIVFQLFKSNYYFRQLYDQVYFKNKFDVQINTGCSFGCSFCVIKKAIGQTKSRPAEDILGDIRKNRDLIKNIHLISDDCGGYGIDLGTSLPELLRQISREFIGSSIDVSEVNPYWMLRYENDFISVLQEAHINSLYLPVQSGSNRVLKDMKRKYDINEVVRLVKTIKLLSPRTFITTHALVGYPGESWLDFLRTLCVLVHFDYFVCFGYSDREGSKSFKSTKKHSNFIINTRYCIARIFQHIMVLFKILFSNLLNFQNVKHSTVQPGNNPIGVS